MTSSAIPARAWADLILLALIWGAIFLVVEFALRGLSPLWLVFHRVFWAALALWLLTAFRRAAMPRAPGAWGAFLVMGALNNAIPFTLITWGQVQIESGLASVLNATTAFFGVVVAAMLLRDERLTLPRLIGVALGLAGVALIVGPGALTGFDLGALGQLAVLGAALSYAFAGAWARRRMAAFTSLQSATGMLTASTLLMAPIAWWVEGAPTLALQGETIAAIAYMSLIGTAAAYLLYYRILAAAGAGNLLLVTVIMPPIAILLGWAVLDERLTLNALAGTGLILIGLATLDGRLWRRLSSAR